ncbi:hypothetical protein Poli38472_001630 [Pythium oligandrum]|uniref:Uncharacterized protein n=1 Tax=Pythium oligandrum TaxID=41045 RepID=A0A8K1CTX2_PYTOL|nr:hypothetical protein Poli38472_001630 [Pythium oligandrum]|eukprot:TMW69474.1 hypothetical protein Poli38472_001630 [Pythium oligandrum]
MGAVNCCLQNSVLESAHTSRKLERLLPIETLNQEQEGSKTQHDDSGASLIAPSEKDTPKPRRRRAASLDNRRSSLCPDLQHLRVVNYLCSCEHCPRAGSFDTLLGRSSRMLSGDETQHELLLSRVLRACANYDETRELDPRLYMFVDKLLHECPSRDEDQIFRHAMGFLLRLDRLQHRRNSLSVASEGDPNASNDDQTPSPISPSALTA